MDVAAEERLELGAGGLADGLDRRALGPEGDALVAVAGDVDDLVDLHRAVLALLPALGLDGELVGELLVEAEGQLLARRLGGEQAEGEVGDLVLGVEPGPGRDLAGEPAPEVLDAVAALGGDHEGRGEGAGGVDLGGEGEEPLGRDPVDLVDGERDGGAGRELVGEAVEDGAHALGQAAVGLDQQDDDVGVGGAAPGGLDHRPVEAAARAEEAGGVDEDELGGALDARCRGCGRASSGPCG